MWTFNNEEINKENFPKDMHGFVYMMGAIIDGKKKYYIGKKTVYSLRKKKLNKKELAERPTKAHKDWKHVRHFEKFEDYYSSSDALKEAYKKGVEIKRVILCMCPTKASLTYEEARHLFRADVLVKDEFLNNCILGKFYASQLYIEDE